MWKVAAAIGLALAFVSASARAATPLDDLCFPAGIVSAQFCLSGGHWESQSTSGAARSTVDLLPLFAIADLNGDGTDEVAGFVAASSGGSATYLHLAVARTGKRRISFVASLPLGDRVQVKDLAVINYQLSVSLIEHGPGEPSCCPTHVTNRRLTLIGSELAQQAKMDFGSVALSDWSGVTWNLVGFGMREAAPAAPAVQVRVDGDQISGFAGCNRFSGTISEEAPREIRIGDLAATGAACGEAETALETRVLAALRSATHYGFTAGMLSLDGDESADRNQVLLFRK